MNVLEKLETQHNPFVDRIVQALSEDLGLLDSVVSAEWDGKEGSLLLRVQPVNPDGYEDLKEVAVEKIRSAAEDVSFRAACRRIRVSGVPNMLFKLTQTS